MVSTGLCECGCGQKTAIAKRNYPERGIHKGKPMRYVPSHSGRARTKLAPPDEVRFWKHVEKTPSCWLWTGPKWAGDYGNFAIGSRTTGVRRVSAHRYAYELVHGPVPSELHVDHLCRVHNCVRPDHLEPVTPQENVLRGVAPAAVNAQKTHCPQGHPYDAENTRWYIRPGRSRPSRYCRKCEEIRTAASGPHSRDKTHCKRGHDLAPDGPNVRLVTGKSGTTRTCRTCARENTAKWRARKAAM